jgi:hypothetical protein
MPAGAISVSQVLSSRRESVPTYYVLRAATGIGRVLLAKDERKMQMLPSNRGQFA